ncbi:MAG: hypothetical protein Kow00127_17520 [Bacteroidales bacterium]
MKAYKDLNMTGERRLVAGWSMLLGLAALLLWFTPIFAQSDTPALAPDIKIDVKKEYDDNGNLMRYDSTWSWSWQGTPADVPLLDSLLAENGWSAFPGLPGTGLFENDSLWGLQSFPGLSGWPFSIYPEPLLKVPDSLNPGPEPQLQTPYGWFDSPFRDMMRRMEELRESNRRFLEELLGPNGFYAPTLPDTIYSRRQRHTIRPDGSI